MICYQHKRNFSEIFGEMEAGSAVLTIPFKTAMLQQCDADCDGGPGALDSGQ